MTRYDLVVVGGGTAGLVAAIGAAGQGARVLLVERDRTGGDCLWTGCVPSKALLAVAEHAHIARNSGHLGVHASEVHVDLAEAMAHVKQAIATIEPHDSPDRLRREGVEVVHGTARFIGTDRIDVDGRPVRFRRAMIATGASPVIPPIPGLAETQPLTSDTVWELTELPRRLVVLGAGPIGAELGRRIAAASFHGLVQATFGPVDLDRAAVTLEPAPGGWCRRRRCFAYGGGDRHRSSVATTSSRTMSRASWRSMPAMSRAS